MSEFSQFLDTKRYAVVTGANKGIGFEICRQLASRFVTVVLTARDPARGSQAIDSLVSQNPAFSGLLVFHQLDVADTASVAALADFVKSEFGKLDILVNNAGITGADVDGDALKARVAAGQKNDLYDGIATQTYELAESCIDTNYYGVKRMIEAFVPLLELSDSPRIVNISSTVGRLKYLDHEWAKGIFINAEDLTEEKVDEVVKVFLQDCKEGLFVERGWPVACPAYIVSKAALNAYARVIAKKYPAIGINCICPGFVKTDMTCNTGFFSVEEGAEGPVRLALTPSPTTGLFYFQKEVSSFE